MKKLNVIKKLMKLKKHHPTRHIKYKVIDFAAINKSVMAYKLP